MKNFLIQFKDGAKILIEDAVSMRVGLIPKEPLIKGRKIKDRTKLFCAKLTLKSGGDFWIPNIEKASEVDLLEAANIRLSHSIITMA